MDWLPAACRLSGLCSGALPSSHWIFPLEKTLIPYQKEKGRPGWVGRIGGRKELVILDGVKESLTEKVTCCHIERKGGYGCLGL